MQGSNRLPHTAGDRSPSVGEGHRKQSIVRAAVPADRGSVTLEMQPGTGAHGQMTLTAHGLEVLIQTLGRVHAAMVEGKPIPQFEVEKLQAVLNPRWQVSPALMGEATTFAFFHPNFGQLGFVVPLDQVAQMMKALETHVAAAAETKTAPRN